MTNERTLRVIALVIATAFAVLLDSPVRHVTDVRDDSHAVQRPTIALSSVSVEWLRPPTGGTPE